MPRYHYSRFTRHEPVYRVRDRGVVIGSVQRFDDRNGFYRGRWFAQLTTDPTVTGKGATRDAAVDDAFRQVGGPG